MTGNNDAPNDGLGLDFWQRIYSPLLGREIKSLIWMPMTSDTPQLIAEFRRPDFSFTGAITIVFGDDAELLLTWAQAGRNIVLAGGKEYSWEDNALDRVRADSDSRWGNIEFSTLESVDLFSAPFIDHGRVLGLRHRVRRDGAHHHFWIGTGSSDALGDVDDLWAGVGVEPSNLSELVFVSTITR